MTVAVIVPARYESKRFPGKPLAKISGKPMIEWVVGVACSSKLANKVIVATDDGRIFDFVKNQLKLEVSLTSKENKSGTDRVAEVVRGCPEIKFVVNLQGDEPLMPSEYIDKVIRSLLSDAQGNLVSLVTPIDNKDELNNPDIVKAVMDNEGFALYFSRSQIPYDRNDKNTNIFYKHIGIYAFTRETLLQFNLLPQSPLEIAEQLEQLRALENGIKIKLEVVNKAYPGVDKPQDIKTVEEILNQKIKAL